MSGPTPKRGMECDSPPTPESRHAAKRAMLSNSPATSWETAGRAPGPLSPVRECDDNSTEPEPETTGSQGMMLPSTPTPKRPAGHDRDMFSIRRHKSPVPFPGSISFDGLNCSSPSPANLSPASPARRPLQPHTACNVNPFSPLASAPSARQSCQITFPAESLSGSGSRYVDDFEQLGKIGEGSFGTVYKCRKRVDGCMYAVKVTRKQTRSDQQRQEMLREVFALATVSQSAGRESAHIVRYFNAWWEDGRLYIQTELCQQSLQDVAHEAAGPLPSELCAAVLQQMLLGLSLIHSHQMCHLDVKPANVFVSSKDGVTTYKLGDLGLATLNSDARDVIEGDSKYLPRELLLEDFSQLPMADIFSLGATVLELALGRPLPGHGDDWQAIRDGQLPLDELTSCTEELKAVIRWMMHPEATQRPTAAELLRHPLFRSEVETLLHRERALASGLQKQLTEVMQARGGYKLKRTVTM